jgi:hypothetical protein
MPGFPVEQRITVDASGYVAAIEEWLTRDDTGDDGSDGGVCQVR